MKTIVDKFDKKAIPELPRVLFEGRIEVVQSEQETRRAVSYLQQQSILGLDTETRPSFHKGHVNEVSLLQISSHDICFLFRLNHIGIPDDLVQLLTDDRHLKIGLSLHDDWTVLRRRREFTPGKHIELQDFVGNYGICDKSLQKIYANIFHQRISKGQRLSNWEADVLSEGQKCYAATDAWACIMIYEELLRMKEEGYKLETTPEPEPQETENHE